MGDYLAVADVRARFTNEDEGMFLTDGDDSVGVAVDDVLNEVINRVEGDMNSRIGMRYKVPVSITGTSAANAPILKSVGLDMVVWYLQGRHQRMSDATQKLYEAAVAWLKEIGSGERVLPADLTEASTNSRNPLGAIGNEDDQSATSHRLFTRDRMKAV